MDNQLETVKGGSFWKGVALAVVCQFAYLFFVFELPTADVRILGYMLFALLQFAYLFPLAVFYRKRDQGLTSNGVIIVGAVSLLAAAVWFGYAAMHGTIPTINDN